MSTLAEIRAEHTSVFPRFFDLAYPTIERGEGVHLYSADGREILDACSGGAIVACLGHGRRAIVDAGVAQAHELAYIYSHHFSNDLQERLAERLLSTCVPEMARVRFVSSGSEANETMLRLLRQYHVDRDEPERWRIISPAQAYHGATMGTLALSGRKGLQHPFEHYLAGHLHVPPANWLFDPSGEATLAELDRLIEQVGAETIAAFVCEPVSGAALPAYSPPEDFWYGLAERAERHGFLVGFDEVITGMGRTGSWFAYQQLPLVPDIVTAGKGLGAGYFPLAAVCCREHVYEALAAGSREFQHGQTWDGAPLPCAVGLAVLDTLVEERLLERVRERGPLLRDELEQALSEFAMVREVRGRGFLLGVELVDPRDGASLLPPEIDAADLIDRKAYEHGLLVTSSHASIDGLAGDQVLLAPSYNASDEELAQMLERLKAAFQQVEQTVRARLA